MSEVPLYLRFLEYAVSDRPSLSPCASGVVTELCDTVRLNRKIRLRAHDRLFPGCEDNLMRSRSS